MGVMVAGKVELEKCHMLYKATGIRYRLVYLNRGSGDARLKGDGRLKRGTFVSTQPISTTFLHFSKSIFLICTFLEDHELISYQ